MKCPQCGVEFEPHDWRQKYCSRQCQIVSKSRRQYAENRDKIRERALAYYYNNKEARLKRLREYYAAHRAELQKKTRERARLKKRQALLGGYSMIIDNVKITADGFNPSRDELTQYVHYVKEREPAVSHVHVTLEEDDLVKVSWTLHNPPFERIRRITGYLVGTTDRWNDAKQAEEHDRVKHI